ncbi:MAG: riboflavin synthase [Candidatus Acidiferrum sp.]
MFTGIIENRGTIEALTLHANGGRVTIYAPTIAPHLAISNSIAVNGCCLTVVTLDKERFSADLSGETIRQTSFGAEEHAPKVGTRVNLEQPLTAGKEFGGHFVLGHVDGVGRVTSLQAEGENWWYGVQVPEEFRQYVVSKGSITIDGVSLTVARWYVFPKFTIQIAVIPYTYEHTNIRDRNPGDPVNLEGDILGKYIDRHLTARAAAAGEPESTLTLASLTDQGF